jgi:DNA-directed RNA polymerase specialized sigma24 family protein
VPDRRENLPQLYRFCFLMMGDAGKAQEAFHVTLREAAARASNGEARNDPFWLYRDAHARCLEAGEHGLQPEDVDFAEEDPSAAAPEQIKRIDPSQLAIWISAAPEPQRTALALFYLSEFDHEEICDLAEIKLGDLSRLLVQGRRQFQAWLNATVSAPEQVI